MPLVPRAETDGVRVRLTEMTRLICCLLILTATAYTSDRARLLAVHEDDRRAHLTGNADLLAQNMAEEVWEARNGTVGRFSREDARKMFAAYFATVKYVEWKDTKPVQVFLSPDGKMAWMLVAVEATVQASGKNGEATTRRFTSSWIATYGKKDGRWKLTGISSTVQDLKD